MNIKEILNQEPEKQDYQKNVSLQLTGDTAEFLNKQAHSISIKPAQLARDLITFAIEQMVIEQAKQRAK